MNFLISDESLTLPWIRKNLSLWFPRLDRLINRRRRHGLNEACEVSEVDVPAESLTDEGILNYDDLDDPDAFV